MAITDEAGMRVAHDHLIAERNYWRDLALRMLTALARAHGVPIDVERVNWFP